MERWPSCTEGILLLQKSWLRFPVFMSVSSELPGTPLSTPSDLHGQPHAFGVYKLMRTWAYASRINPWDCWLVSGAPRLCDCIRCSYIWDGTHSKTDLRRVWVRHGWEAARGKGCSRPSGLEGRKGAEPALCWLSSFPFIPSTPQHVGWCHSRSRWLLPLM